MPSDFLNALKEGATLQEYQVVRVLGAGGFGLTYLAFDKNLDKPVAIKEYLPNELALRQGDSQVMAKSTEAKEDFQWGLDQFLREARTLAKFNHPNIIRINRFFESNGTGYIVMDYAEGQTLTDKIKEVGAVPEAELKSILLSISDGLRQAHGFGILHRDIKPGNIMLLDDSTPILIDFGSARQAIGVKSKSVTSIVTPGYAPIEQYDTNGKQGPWTDIYALGAVAYVALVGERPPDATSRIRVDNMTPVAELANGKASEAFLKAIDWALSPHEEGRPQKIDDWVKALSGQDIKSLKVKAESLQMARGIDDEKTVLNKTAGKTTPTPTAADQDINNKWMGESNSENIDNTYQGKGHLTAKLIGGIVVVAILALSYPYLSGVFDDGESVDYAEGESQEQVTEIETDSGADTGAESGAADDVAIINQQPDDEVETLTEQQAWQRAVNTNTIESYVEYLSGFPQGQHVGEANINLAGLSEHNNNAGEYYAVSRVNVRRWPSTAAETLRAFDQGQRVRVKGKVVMRDWYSLEGVAEGRAFVHSSLLSESFDNEAGLSAQEREREEIRQRWRDAIQQHDQ